MAPDSDPPTEAERRTSGATGDFRKLSGDFADPVDAGTLARQATGEQRAVIRADRQATGELRRVPGRVHVGDLVGGASALALLIVMFAFAWYGVAGVADPSAARPALAVTENGFTALSVVRWVMLLTIAVAVGAVVLHAAERRAGRRTETGLPVLGLGLLTSALLVWRVLVSFPTPDRVIDQKFGALLGLTCALGIAYGGHESLVAQRDRRSQARRAGPAAPGRHR